MWIFWSICIQFTFFRKFPVWIAFRKDEPIKYHLLCHGKWHISSDKCPCHMFCACGIWDVPANLWPARIADRICCTCICRDSYGNQRDQVYWTATPSDYSISCGCSVCCACDDSDSWTRSKCCIDNCTLRTTDSHSPKWIDPIVFRLHSEFREHRSRLLVLSQSGYVSVRMFYFRHFSQTSCVRQATFPHLRYRLVHLSQMLLHLHTHMRHSCFHQISTLCFSVNVGF